MPVAGTHAIAVGLPEGIHFAFDAEQVRLAQAWKGRFLDAQGTWFSRFAPPARPLGDSVIALPPGPMMARLSADDDPWPDSTADTRALQFDGYRVDPAGVPTFLYRIGSLQVEDRIQAANGHTLTRRLSLHPSGDESESPPLCLRPLAGKTLIPADDATYSDTEGLTVTLDPPVTGRIRQSQDLVEWIVPLDLSNVRMIEVRYSW
jgi:hypothetical protein